MKAKIAASLFFLFLLCIIWAADTGRMPSPLRAIYDFPNGDKVGHITLFGILAFLAAKALPRSIHLGRARLPIAIVALLVFSAVEEASQTLFSTRTADIVDLVCSWTGIFLGNWAALRWGNSAEAER